MEGRISAQPPGADFLAAGLTIQIFAVIHAPQREEQSLPAPLTSRLCGLRHGLNLHRIHTGEATDALLIQRHRGGIRFRFLEKLIDFRELGLNARTKFGQQLLLIIRKCITHHETLQAEAKAGSPVELCTRTWTVCASARLVTPPCQSQTRVNPVHGMRKARQVRRKENEDG